MIEREVPTTSYSIRSLHLEVDLMITQVDRDLLMIDEDLIVFGLHRNYQHTGGSVGKYMLLLSTLISLPNKPVGAKKTRRNHAEGHHGRRIGLR